MASSSRRRPLSRGYSLRPPANALDRKRVASAEITFSPKLSPAVVASILGARVSQSAASTIRVEYDAARPAAVVVDGLRRICDEHPPKRPDAPALRIDGVLYDENQTGTYEIRDGVIYEEVPERDQIFVGAIRPGMLD